MLYFPGTFRSRIIQLSHEEVLAAGQIAVSAAAMEGLGTALLEAHGFSVQGHIHVFGHRMMKVSYLIRSAVNKHRIAWLILQWVTMWKSQVLNTIKSFALFPARYVCHCSCCWCTYCTCHPWLRAGFCCCEMSLAPWNTGAKPDVFQLHLFPAGKMGTVAGSWTLG